MTLNANDSCSRDNCSCSLSPTDALRSRVGGVKVRHKRQVLQDMARPLKHWLYKHRDNPYPTKTEKVLLALGSHMTLVQVRGDALSVHLGLTSSFQVLQQGAVHAGFQLVCKRPATAEEHGETAGPELGAEDQTVQQLHPGKCRAAERVQRRHRHGRYQLTAHSRAFCQTSRPFSIFYVVSVLRSLMFFWCPLCCRWGVSPSNTPKPVAVLQVVPRRRAPEAGRCPHQRGRRRLPSVKVQEQLAQPLPERHTAAHDGSGGARRRPGPQEEEPLWVVQLHGGRPRRRLAGVILRSRGQLCPSEGWEMPPLFLLDLMWKFPVLLIKIYVYHAATWHFN